jgi:hypothetical protein
MFKNVLNQIFVFAFLGELGVLVVKIASFLIFVRDSKSFILCSPLEKGK